ncbi:hypothetical protein 8014-B2_009 [Lactobacillus phage ATCC 8014-B2]|uniref:Uncharacterized protein n=1 Tax=Lactobacillus phage ATCC 8014-B2 TaxID=1225795 RepID=K4HZM3_9CAUD|nr:hypothetical protein HOQ89_gp009 [Lactobacillus phage ATCC 8014-B2]AFU63076.1 hypothetical protein 8014-B2_009 [Lactobacillus phage ATCC 8014-B2]
MENGKIQVMVNTGSVYVDSDFDQAMTIALLLHSAAKIVKKENRNNDDKLTDFEFANLALESYED